MVKKAGKKAPRVTRPRKPTMAERADRHALYEAAVQCVEHEIDFVDAEFKRLRGHRATTLREDFCGTGNTSCEWVRRRPANRAVGVDLDAEVLGWGLEHHVAGLTPSQRRRLSLIEGDVLKFAGEQAQILLAMNFSYWLFRERAQLRNYFKRALANLTSDGVFFLDCFGGYESFQELTEHTEHKRFTYTWEHASYNPINGDFTCNIHFSFPDGSRLKQAFTYEWRLWTLPEIRELLTEAGFTRTTVYWQGWDEKEQTGSADFTPTEVADPDAGWICYIAAEK